MDLPEVRQRVNLLFDFYEPLLTLHQREVFAMRYMEDNSLSEISKFFGITPQGVADMLKRTIGRLEHYDKQLALVEKHEHRQATIEKIRNALAASSDAEMVVQITKFLDELTQ